MASLFDGFDLNDTMTQPLFLAGANLALGGGPQGMMSGFQYGNQMQHRRRQEQAAQSLFADPEVIKSLGPMANVFRGMGAEGMPYAAQAAMRQPYMAFQREKFSHDQRMDQARLAEARRGHDMQYSAMKFQTPEGRMEVAAKLGIQPGTPAYQQFVATGSMTKPDPLDEIVGGLATQMRPQAQRPAAAMSPAPEMPGPRLIPQSYQGEQADQNFIRTQAGSPALAAPVDMVDTPLGKMQREQARTLGMAFALKGKGDAGKMMTESPNSFGKEGTNDIEKQLIGRMVDLADLQDIQAGFRPEFQSLGGKARATGLGWKSYIQGGLSGPEEKKALQDFASHRAVAFERLNTRIKLMSGTAVSGKEEERMYKANPNPGTGIFDGDDPDTFQAKLKTQVDMQKAAIMRYNLLRSKGAIPEQISELAKSGKIEGFMSLGEVRNAYDRRGAEIMQQLQQQNPKASPQQLRDVARQSLKREFGI